MTGSERTPVGDDTTLAPDPTHSGSADLRRAAPRLVVIWCGKDPQRVGELVVAGEPGDRRVFELGRGEGKDTVAVRAELVRSRPFGDEPRPPLGLRGLSRRQLLLRQTSGGALRVESVGRCPMRIDGAPQREATIVPGQVVELEGQVVFLCVSRGSFEGLHHVQAEVAPRFGRADRFGLVGESPTAWTLRDRVAFVAARPVHVLLLGASGTGKELVARAVHGLSDRDAKELVARNAATLPEGLVDAELFGNVAGYPNPGMKERPGLIGRAHRSTLFLDEIGELPQASQAHLLRVLDDGDYHRLGDATKREADLRLVAATNRALAELKHDFAARFKLRIQLPGLNERREDIPLLLDHLARRIAQDDQALRERFFDASQNEAVPRFDPALVTALVHHDYELHVRELEALLWRAIASSPADRIELTDEVREELELVGGPVDSQPDRGEHVSFEELDPEHVQAVLDKNDGVQEKTWRELGLKNRYVLIRFIRKHGLEVRRSRHE